MAEDKLIKEKKTKEIKEDIYALNLDFENDTTIEEVSVNSSEVTEIEDDTELIFLKGYEEDDEEPKKKKVLSKIEEGIKSSKRGRGRPRKNPNIAIASTFTKWV